MKKPIIFSVLFFIISSISSFGQGVWIEEEEYDDADGNYRIGKIQINNKIYEINENAILVDADLSGVDLSNTWLRGANLTGANLRGTNLALARLSRTNFTGADLSGANLTGAQRYANVNFTRANLSGTDLRSSTALLWISDHQPPLTVHGRLAVSI